MNQKVQITDPNEIHLMLVEKYQESSVNGVISALIDHCYSDFVYQLAAEKLVMMHPYINARYVSEFNSGRYEYFYETIDRVEDKVVFNSVSDNNMETIMNSLSNMRFHRFDHEQGDIFKFSIYKGRSKSIVELSYSHVIGEGPSGIILLGDYLNLLDALIGKDDSPLRINKKYFFNEADFGWDRFEYNLIEFEEPKELSFEKDPWTIPVMSFRRYRMDNYTFVNIKKWLMNNNIHAKTSDVFYFVANEILKKITGRTPDFWTIVNCRTKLLNSEFDRSLYNFAFFSSVDTSKYEGDGVKNWLESFYEFRDNLITREGVCNSKNIFYSLNKAMEGTKIESGKKIMDSIVKFPDFAFNNFGCLDEYIGRPRNFKIIDFGIQDGVPTQEIRYFSLHDVTYINQTFFTESDLDLDEFWSLFIDKLEKINDLTVE